MKNFQVSFLTATQMKNARNLDFRYEHVDEDNLGFADPVKNRIFVLATKDKEFQKYLINHELEHLLGDKSHEDEYGILHKKGPKFFKDILMPALTAGLGGFAAGGPIGGGIGAGIGGLQGFQGYQNRVNAARDPNSPQNLASRGGQYQGQGGMNQMFPSFTGQNTFGQSFGQFGATSPAGFGPSGGVSPIANPGLSAGIPGQGQQGQGQQGVFGNQAGASRPYMLPDLTFGHGMLGRGYGF